ncbi:MAG: RNA methyltransferase, partial [Pseudomonadota bacterium]
GGKTLQLAAAGAETAALDASAARLARVQANLARTGLSATLIEADALAWRPAEPAPAVLLDAPCSALGTLRRHPEATLIRDGADLDAFTALQDRLLDAAWEMVAPGGWLVFCTCSPLKAEGEERVAALRARRPDAAPDPIGPKEIGDGALIREGALRALPSHWAETGGLDGFFAARLRKAS